MQTETVVLLTQVVALVAAIIPVISSVLKLRRRRETSRRVELRITVEEREESQDPSRN